MGQNQSKREQTAASKLKTKIPPISQMQQLGMCLDIRYGDIKIMQSVEGMYAVKTRIFQDTESFKLYQASHEKVNDNDEYIIQMVGLQHNTEKNICSSFTKTYSFYEYYSHDLRKDLDEVIQSQQRYEEIEIVAMMSCMLNALITLKFAMESHGDIRPSTIIMTGPSQSNPIRDSQINPLYKLTNIQELTQMNAYRRQLSKPMQGATLYLSPEQIEELRYANLKPVYDASKSDIFSLGLVALEMASLHEISDFYDLDSHTFHFSKLEDQLNIVQKEYSPQLLTILEHLLNMSPQSRPDLMMAKSLFTSYEFQLSNYFNHANVKQNTLSYSLDPVSLKLPENIKTNSQLQAPIHQQPLHQEPHREELQREQPHLEQPHREQPPRKEPQRAEPQRAEPQRVDPKRMEPLQNITNRDPQEVIQFIGSLDNKVKQALMRSSEAQSLYQQSRIKEFYSETYPLDKVTSNLELYSHLPPINSASLVYQAAANDNYSQFQDVQSHRESQSQQYQYSRNLASTSRHEQYDLQSQQQKRIEPHNDEDAAIILHQQSPSAYSYKRAAIQPLKDLMKQQDSPRLQGKPYNSTFSQKSIDILGPHHFENVTPEQLKTQDVNFVGSFSKNIAPSGQNIQISQQLPTVSDKQSMSFKNKPSNNAQTSSISAKKTTVVTKTTSSKTNKLKSQFKR